MREIVVAVEDSFPSSDPRYCSRLRSVVALAVGTPEDLLRESVVLELRDRVSTALGGGDVDEPTVVVFAGVPALDLARAELAGLGEWGLSVGVQALDPGSVMHVPTPEKLQGQVPAHSVQIVDAPLPNEVVVALRSVAAQGLP